MLHHGLLPPGHGCKRGRCISTWLWAEPGEKELSSAFSCALSYSKPRCKENFAGLCFNLLLRESPDGLEVVVVRLGVVKDVASASTGQELVWDHTDAERKSRLLLFSRVKTPNSVLLGRRRLRCNHPVDFSGSLLGEEPVSARTRGCTGAETSALHLEFRKLLWKIGHLASMRLVVLFVSRTHCFSQGR